MSLLILKDFTAFDFILLTLGLEASDFSDMNLIFYLNSMLRFCGNVEEMASTTQDMSGLECGYVTEKFKTFTILLVQSL
jgi:hypothetical protein